MDTATLLFAAPGGVEPVAILLLAALLFGARKIPQLARASGEAIGGFKKGREKTRQELEGLREEN
ncbi:twin-arginine translocase TatA/TatE family subunit [Halobacteriales archaeon QS_9_68_17]|nr:MAG: twin-arginine translocase TatA/TatE family subunit [Halobacteriales archaeon QS_9_68_17]